MVESRSLDEETSETVMEGSTSSNAGEIAQQCPYQLKVGSIWIERGE